MGERKKFKKRNRRLGNAEIGRRKKKYLSCKLRGELKVYEYSW